MDLYRERIDARTQDGDKNTKTRDDDQIDRNLRIMAVSGERQEIFRIAREGKIGSQVAQKLVRELDLLELRYKL